MSPDKRIHRRTTAAVLATAMIWSLGVASGSAKAQGVAGYAPPPKGFVVRFKRTFDKKGKTTKERFSHTVIASRGEEVVYRVDSRDASNGDRVRLFRGIFSYAFFRAGEGWVEYKFDRAALRALWPLRAGKRATVKMDYGYGLGKTLEAGKAAWKVTESGSIDYSILRQEKVTTPFGTFHAYVIQRDRKFTKIADKSVGIQRRIGWFVPELGYIVRQTVRRGPASANAKPSRLEVVEIK